jgi:xanthine dehydrogenase accessory factor
MPKKRPVRVPESFFRAVADRLARREPMVMVTVASSSGSAPGKAGAKMAVTRDGQTGTVGGGKIEQAALARARELLAAAVDPADVPPPVTETYDVVQDLGMTCGGTMALLFEPMTPPPRLVIFGAGHVSEELCACATRAGFDVWVADERAEWLTEARFPDARERVLGPLADAVAKARLDAGTFVASVTPGHASDESVVRAILAAGVNPRYLGVIGSRRKAVELRKGLVESGVSPEDAGKIRIPMGIDIGAAEPREIAVSVTAELIAVLRGADAERRW